MIPVQAELAVLFAVVFDVRGRVGRGVRVGVGVGVASETCMLTFPRGMVVVAVFARMPLLYRFTFNGSALPSFFWTDTATIPDTVGIL